MIDLYMAYMLMLLSMTWPWCKIIVGWQRQKFSVELFLTTKQATSIKLATTVGHYFLRDHDFADVYILTTLFLLLWIKIGYRFTCSLDDAALPLKHLSSPNATGRALSAPKPNASWGKLKLPLKHNITIFIYLFIEGLYYIAQSVAQGHLRAFHKFNSGKSWIQYKTCTLHQRKT